MVISSNQVLGEISSNIACGLIVKASFLSEKDNKYMTQMMIKHVVTRFNYIMWCLLFTRLWNQSIMLSSGIYYYNSCNVYVCINASVYR